MNISRNFLVLGTSFLLIGLLIGMYMGGSGDHSLAASHAHINLIGFVLSSIFALTYRAFPAMTDGRLPIIHFWTHAIGAIGLNVLLFLLLSGKITEAAMAPWAPITEVLITIGVLIFAWNVIKNAK
jgi:hypothetical protein